MCSSLILNAMLTNFLSFLRTGRLESFVLFSGSQFIVEDLTTISEFFSNFGTLPFKAYFLANYGMQNIFNSADSIIETESI